MQADKYGVPRICFVNKMDRMGADFFNTVKMIVSNLGATPAVLQVRCAGLYDMKKHANVIITIKKQVCRMAFQSGNGQNKLAGNQGSAVLPAKQTWM